MNVYTFILTTLGLGVVFSLLAVLSERILIIAGLTRGNTIGLVIATFLLIVFKQVLDYGGSMYIFGSFIVIVGPIGANRCDLANTLRKGRWWWKSEK
jgi:hypothetical protein